MKKILAVLTATTALSSVAVADVSDPFYVKVAVGGQSLNKVKTIVGQATSSLNPFVSGGVGYRFMENLRADLTFDYYFNPKFSKSGKLDGANVKDEFKNDLMGLMLNGYVDLFDVSVANVFVGAGVGWSRLGAKETLTNTDTGATKEGKIEASNNFAYSLTVGASAELSDGINAELAYSWKDFGKFKDSTAKAKGHHVAFGVRFSI